jgi:hypothetical protein
VALVRTDVSEEPSASIIRMKRINALGTSAITSNQLTLQRNIILVFLHSMCQLLVMANVPSSPILVTQMMGALSSSVTSVLTRLTWRNIPVGGILQSNHCENLKSYNIFNVCFNSHRWFVLCLVCMLHPVLMQEFRDRG